MIWVGFTRKSFIFFNYIKYILNFFKFLIDLTKSDC